MATKLLIMKIHNFACQFYCTGGLCLLNRTGDLSKKKEQVGREEKWITIACLRSHVVASYRDLFKCG
jgi:hypothetical protein